MASEIVFKFPFQFVHCWCIECSFCLHIDLVCMCSVAQSCLTPGNPMHCSPSGSSVHGILQARTLQWVAISSSNADLVTCDTEAFISWSYSAYVLLCVFMPKSFTPFYPVLSRLLIIFHISLFC